MIELTVTREDRVEVSGEGKKSKYELGSLGQAALTKLAKHKKEKAKSPLDRMWERRIAQRAYISDFKA